MDFVWLLYHTKGINDQNLKERYHAASKLAVEAGTVNWGDVKSGPVVLVPEDKILAGITDKSRVRGAFKSIEDATKYMADLKEADLGLCLIIAGPLDMVLDGCKKAGVKPHTMNYSLGIFGNLSKLASEETRAISCMCGHHMVPDGVIAKERRMVAKGKRDPKKSALKLAKLCPCGIFNQERAEALLRQEATEAAKQG
jgi:hypothetical protein